MAMKRGLLNAKLEHNMEEKEYILQIETINRAYIHVIEE